MEEILNVSVIEDALQLEASNLLQFERVACGDVVAVKRSLRTSVLRVKERQQNPAGFHRAVDALDERLHQGFRKKICQIPEHHSVEFLTTEAEIVAQVAIYIQSSAPLGIRNDQRFIVRQPQHVFLVEAMTEARHESYVGW